MTVGLDNVNIDQGLIAIIGIDCATQPDKVGLARGSIANGLLSIDSARKVAKNESVANLVSSWIKEKNHVKILITIDSPLGWPIKLGEELIHHVAGASLSTSAHQMFRRRTDFFIKEKANKQSLDVGADRIARTAHAALALLKEISEQLAVSIPLAWGSVLTQPISVIEVYPAVTLKSCGLLPATSYKKENGNEREKIYDGLINLMDLSNVDKLSIIEDDDILDAVACVLAGYHFVSGESEQSPTEEDRVLAEKEGWIWAKIPN